MKIKPSTWGKCGRSVIGLRRVVRVACLLAVMWFTGDAEAVPSIFDDDWVPPQREAVAPPKAPPVAAPVAPATTPAVRPPPVAPTPVVPSNPSSEPPAAVAAVPTRRPIPTKAEAATARKLMREVYAKELANRTAAARKTFARALLDDAKKTGDAPVDRYVLLGGAFQAATEAQDARLSLEAADALAAGYDVDVRAMKLAALSAAGRSGDADEAKAVIDQARALIDTAVVHDDYDTVRKAAGVVESAATRTRDAAVADEARAQVKAARAVADEYTRVQRHVATLAGRPDDPAANLAVGRFACFSKDDWPRGLPLLAKGADAALRGLAVSDLGAGDDPAKAFAVAEAWWARGEGETGRAKDAVRSRAAYWYERAMPGLSGLNKLSAEKRLVAARPAVSVFLSDLAEVDFKGFSDGTWSFGKNGSITGRSQKPIRVEGAPSPHGLGLHPPSNGSSTVTYALKRGFKLFSGGVALDDTGKQGTNPVTFRIVGDGKDLWKSEPVSVPRALQRFSIDVRGVEKLQIIVTCDGGNDGARAVWVEPVLFIQ